MSGGMGQQHVELLDFCAGFSFPPPLGAEVAVSVAVSLSLLLGLFTPSARPQNKDGRSVCCRSLLYVSTPLPTGFVCD